MSLEAVKTEVALANFQISSSTIERRMNFFYVAMSKFHGVQNVFSSIFHRQRSFAAMSYVDSQSVFRARCEEIKLSIATIDALTQKGWDTFGSYAFSVSTNPAQISDEDFDAKVAGPILGGTASGEAALLRRLLFESYTLTATELKRKADNNESDGPKKLPVQEIATRFTALEKKLSPIKIESVLEPSHSLINSLAQCCDDGRLRYVEWAKCTSRTMELNNIKESSALKIWKADSAGVIKQTEAETLLRCDVGTELEVLNALKRRGIAFELSKLMSFEKHEMIISLLFGELQREPLDGFKRPSLAQLAAADREIHIKLAEKTRAGLPLGPQGELPLDTYVEAILELPAVMWLLMPKPKGAATDKHGPSNANSKPDPKKAPKSDDKKFPPKSNKFDKLKGKRGKTPMPVQLRGGTPIDNEGRSICYGFNLGSCHDKSCKRGRHVCCKPGCFSPSHNFINHDKAS